GLLIVFFGTLAQVDMGLWAAQTRWFRSFYVVGKLDITETLRIAGDLFNAHWIVPHRPHLMPWAFPGGYLIGWLTMINLIAAHIKRFQWGTKKIGIHLAHAGVIILLFGQFLTDKLARESLMSLREDQTKVYSESHRENELVFASDFDANREEVVSIPGDLLAKKKEITHAKLPFTIRVKEYAPNGELTSRASLAKSAGQLATALATLESQYSTPEGLPAQAERALESSGREVVWRAALKALGEPDKGDLVAIATKISKEPERAGRLNAELKTRFREEMLARFAQASPARMRLPSTEAAAMHIAAAQARKGAPASPEAFPRIASNGSGQEAIVTKLEEASDMDTRNMPYAVLELIENGASKGTWLVTPWIDNQEITVSGRTYRMAFRFERYYQPFSVTLLKATHEVYPGTATSANPEGIPKNFQSRVLITNPERGEKREVDIYMNNPLRYGRPQLTYYQYQMGSDETATGTPVGTSTFQVVKNPGANAPYVGCILVGAGLIYQFMYHLVVFIGRLSTPRPPPLSEPVKPRRESTRAPQPVR
ncbi:MAG TPA: cytochrome c biogenesis protein ResB, partial [Chthoniobacteraceae bacterium]|nr:cytochrome c biogenesis protein ResB [Chthoniobacteraceae bacterium]